MDDETILTVATGRKCLLGKVMKTLEDNLHSDSVAQHMLIRGPRGMGKSFFLKYLQIKFRQSGKFDNCEFLLLPEEQNNINTPSDLIKLILSELTQQSGVDATTFWEEPDEVWQMELQKLKQCLSEKKSAQKDYMLVVVLENLDTFLRNIQSDKKTAKVSESRFRHLLEKIKDLTIIGAVPRVDSDIIDGNYNKRLFHAFKKCTLKKWTTEDYFKYFDRRKDLSDIQMTAAEESLKRAKLKALSHFTGGSPRMAVVLTNLLLEDDVISTANTLFGLIDDLTPYYQDLTKSIPKKSKILFDTLIRKGENLSQSELAEAVGATQNKISKAFLWLKDNGYVIGKKRSDSPAFSYQVADRIHVLYYQLREIHHNQGITPIWLLSDFLVAFYQSDELRTHAFKALSEQPSANANDLAKLYLISSGLFVKENLPDLESSQDWMGLIEKNKEIKILLEKIEEQIKTDNQLPSTESKDNVNELIKFLDNINHDSIVDNYVIEIADHFMNYSFEEQKFHYTFHVLENFLIFENKIHLVTKSMLYAGIAICHYFISNFDEVELYFEKSNKLLEVSGVEGLPEQLKKMAEEVVESAKEQKRFNNFITENYVVDKDGNFSDDILDSLIEIEKEFGYEYTVNWGYYLVSSLDDDIEGRKIVPYLATNWLKSGVSTKLIIDVFERILRENSEPEVRTHLETALHTIHYLKSEKQKTISQTLRHTIKIIA